MPNTYEFFWNTSPDTFLQRMRQESDKFWTSRDAKLSRSGLTRQQAYILASIVYEETKRKNEMPRVAGVYVNRLKRGMPLQADPTVKYAVGDFALRRVLNRHLEVDSPYNTLQISRVTARSDLACRRSMRWTALSISENHDYLYFCAKDDLSGAHAFARTLAEHNRNAQAYARALNRRGSAESNRNLYRG
ncbi:MAG: endolytic transglycosylase MltG [Alistipes indistinctus]